MKTYMKKIGLGLLALGLMFTAQSKVHAYSDVISSNNAAALVVRITPNADRGVTISSGNLNLNLGLVDLGASTQTISPATVTINGNMINSELELDASIAGGWSFDPNQTFLSTGANLLNAWVQFTSVSTGLAPAQSYEYFRVGTSSGSKLAPANSGPTYAATAVGNVGAPGVGMFENNEGVSGTFGGDMDAMSAGDVRHMFTYFRLPPTTSITGAQDINITLSVRAGP